MAWTPLSAPTPRISGKAIMLAGFKSTPHRAMMPSEAIMPMASGKSPTSMCLTEPKSSSSTSTMATRAQKGNRRRRVRRIEGFFQPLCGGLYVGKRRFGVVDEGAARRQPPQSLLNVAQQFQLAILIARHQGSHFNNVADRGQSLKAVLE